MFIFTYTINKNNEPIPIKEEIKEEIKTNKVWIFAKQKGKEIARKLYNEITDRNIVGGSQEEEFIFENKAYKIQIDAFWEKVRYFDISVNGINYNRSESYEF